MTLLSTQLLTAAFGEHDPARELVGLLFDTSKCHIHSLFAIDHATHYKPWLHASLEDATNYIRETRAFYFSDIDAFRQRLELNPFIHNEILVKIPYDRVGDVLLAIVIAKDTPTARIMALQQACKIKKELRISLPIVFYNRFAKTLQLYTPEQRKQDREESIAIKLSDIGYSGFSFAAAQEARNALQRISNDLLPLPTGKTTLSGNVFSLFKFTRDKIPLIIKEIIDDAKQQDNDVDWFVAAEKIRRLLRGDQRYLTIFQQLPASPSIVRSEVTKRSPSTPSAT